MATKFLSPDAQFRAGVNMREEPTRPTMRRLAAAVGSEDRSRPSRRRARSRGRRPSSEFAAMRNQEDAPPCSDLRLDHDPQRQLLQVRELWDHQRLCMMKTLIIWGE